MTRIVRTPAANADYDLTGATVFSDGTVPFDLTMDSGSYKFYRLSEPTGSITVTSGSTAFWTQAAAGPRFESVSNLGSGVRRIDVEARIYVPSSLSGDSTNNLFRIGTSGYVQNLNLTGTSNWSCTGGGGLSVGGTSRTFTWDTTPNTLLQPRDEWVTVRFDLNVNDGEMSCDFYVGGVLQASATVSGAAGDIDGGTTKLVLCSRQNGGGGVDMGPGVQFEYIDVNVNGTDYGRVEGSAATVNALTTPFAKAGDDAT